MMLLLWHLVMASSLVVADEVLASTRTGPFGPSSSEPDLDSATWRRARRIAHEEAGLKMGGTIERIIYDAGRDGLGKSASLTSPVGPGNSTEPKGVHGPGSSVVNDLWNADMTTAGQLSIGSPTGTLSAVPTSRSMGTSKSTPAHSATPTRARTSSHASLSTRTASSTAEPTQSSTAGYSMATAIPTSRAPHTTATLNTATPSHTIVVVSSVTVFSVAGVTAARATATPLQYESALPTMSMTTTEGGGLLQATPSAQPGEAQPKVVDPSVARSAATTVRDRDGLRGRLLATLGGGILAMLVR